MRRNQRKSVQLCGNRKVGLFLNDGEKEHSPHVHAKRGKNDWRIYLRTGEWEKKAGDFNGNERRELTRLYSTNYNMLVGRWDGKDPRNKV